jgi:Flp pilus assembly protein TadG
MWWRRQRLVERILRRIGDDHGAVALELALIGIPLVFLVMATLETILVMLVSTSLAAATNEAAREIRTGQVSAATTTSQAFGQLVCSNMSWFGAQCVNNISVNSQVFSSFSSATPPTVVQNGAFNTANLQFATGAPGDIILVNTYITWNLVTPLLSSAFGGLSNGQILITASSAFRNEP